MKSWLILGFLIIFITVKGIAQNAEFISIVYLKDGSVLEGRMTEFRENQYIKMDLGGNEVTISYDSIQKIRHKSLSNKMNSIYKVREKGLYNQTSLGFLPGTISSVASLGLELDHSAGYLFNRWLGLGLNLGVANYDEESNDIYYSLAGECRGYFLGKNSSPYYAMRLGYGFINKNETFLESNGGYFVNPALGYRFFSGNKISFMLETGLAFQKGYYKQDLNFWWWGGTTGQNYVEKDILYRRFSLKLGVLF